MAFAKTEEVISPPVLLAVAASVALACVWIVSEWNPSETGFIWRHPTSLLTDLSREEGRDFGLFDPPLLCVKVVCGIGLVPITAVSFALGNGLLYMGLPTSWYRLAQSYGWLSADSEYDIWWLIAFFPLELVSALVPLMTNAYLCMMAFIGQQTIKTYGENIL